MERHLIIVAGGTGTRMRTPVAKQFIELEGLPLMWWTLRRFREALGADLDVTLVLYPGLFEEFAALEAKHGPAGVDRVVPGGAERFHSVKAGLDALGQSWAAEVEATNLKVNLLDPGGVATSMYATAYPGIDPKSIPQPEDIAPAFVALASINCPYHGQIIRASALLN